MRLIIAHIYVLSIFLRIQYYNQLKNVHFTTQILAYLIRNDNLSRVKIARFLSNEKYSILRIKLGIIALKSAMANICANQKIVKRENLGALSYFSITNDK